MPAPAPALALEPAPLPPSDSSARGCLHNKEVVNKEVLPDADGPAALEFAVGWDANSCETRCAHRSGCKSTDQVSRSVQQRN